MPSDTECCAFRCHRRRPEAQVALCDRATLCLVAYPRVCSAGESFQLGCRLFPEAVEFGQPLLKIDEFPVELDGPP